MKRIALVLITVVLAPLIAFGQGKEKDFSKYDALDISSSNLFIEMASLNPGEGNYGSIISALRKIRQYRLEYARRQVRDLVDTCSPLTGQSKEIGRSFIRQTFNEAVLTLGAISREEFDAIALMRYYREARDSESKYYLVWALGQMDGVSNAVSALNEICDTFPAEYLKRPDDRLLGVLIDSIGNLNSRSSLVGLSRIRTRIRMSPEMLDRISQVQTKISKTGK